MLENLKLVRDFFPLVLLKGHLKYNFFGLLYWALLFAIIFESFGANFGVPFFFKRIPWRSQLMYSFTIGFLFGWIYNEFTYTAIQN